MSFSGGIFIFGVFFKDCWSFKDCRPAPPLWVWLSAGAAGVSAGGRVAVSPLV